MHTAKDPVCGMQLNEETAPYKTVFNNTVYYFSSAACQTEFNRNLAKYVKEVTSEPTSHYGGYCGPMAVENRLGARLGTSTYACCC